MAIILLLKNNRDFVDVGFYGRTTLKLLSSFFCLPSFFTKECYNFNPWIICHQIISTIQMFVIHNSMIMYKKKWKSDTYLQDHTVKVIALHPIVTCKSCNESPFMLNRIIFFLFFFFLFLFQIIFFEVYLK